MKRLIFGFRLGVSDTLMGMGHLAFDGFVWIGALIGVSVICEAGPGAVVDSFYGSQPGGIDEEPRGVAKIVDEGLSSW